jgi:pimeloyl-ACP methyl ester carboxylesterase
MIMSNNSSQAVTLKNPTTGPASANKKPLPIPMALKLLRLGFRIGGRLSPTIAGRMAYKLWFTPGRFKTPAREKPALLTAKLATHQINHNSIITYSWGETNSANPVVLLVHGWSGRGTQLGAFVQPLINAGYRVLSFDAPAHGKSSGKQTNLYEVADVILALQQHYGAINSVISHSFGGPCIATAIQRGFTTSRIVSISPPATVRGLVEKFNSTLHVPKKAGQKMMRQIENTFDKDIWQDISMLNTVKEITIEGLVIHDSNDTDIPWQEGKAVSDAWNKSRFIKTSGLGHRRILRDDFVIETAVAFIKGN